MAVEMVAARRRFTRAEYYRMAEVGILRPHDRVELIKGAIVEMSPIGRRHNAFVANLTQLLVLRLAGRAIVWVQSSFALADDTEPQPDFAVLRRGTVSYKERDAWAEDALLVIEVAESSLAYDRSTKQRLYAEARIPEYWVVDVLRARAVPCKDREAWAEDALLVCMGGACQRAPNASSNSESIAAQERRSAAAL